MLAVGTQACRLWLLLGVSGSCSGNCCRSWKGLFLLLSLLLLLWLPGGLLLQVLLLPVSLLLLLLLLPVSLLLLLLLPLHLFSPSYLLLLQC